MNLAIRGIEANLGPQHADTFHHDLHKDLKADFVLANPPFNVSDWGGERLREDADGNTALRRRATRTTRGCSTSSTTLPPTASPASSWPTGRCRPNQSGEGEIRKAIVEADLVDCMIALPGQLFYTTQIPVCLWFVTRSKKNGKVPRPSRPDAFHRRPQVGLIDRVHREITDDEIARIAGTYHAGAAKARVRGHGWFLQGRHLERFARTATSSRRAATSAPKTSRMTESRSTTRCGGSAPHSKSNSPSRPS